MSTAPIIFLLVPAAIALVGLIVLVRGFRGRVLDDHPLCAQCGFDLSGTPASADVCSECGSNIRLRPASVRIGHRQRQPWLIVVGLGMLVPFVAGLGLAGWGSTQNVNWIEYEPAWWLMHQASGTNSISRDIALTELSRRLSVGLLSASNTDALMERALAFQADSTKTWVVGWGNLIQSARAAGKLSDENWKRYAAHAATMVISARQQVRRGDPVPIRFGSAGAHVGANCPLWLWEETTDDGSDLARPSQGMQMSGTSGLSSSGGSSSTTNVPLDSKRVANAALGMKTARLKLRIKIYEGQQMSEPTGTPLAEQEFQLKTTWELVDADAPTVKTFDDESVRAAVEKSLTVINAEISQFGVGYLMLNLKADLPPVPMAFEMFVRAQGREWPVGTVDFRAGANSQWGTGGECRGLTADRVDVILRPSMKAAVGTMDLTSYWDGQVVIKDVPVKHPKPGK